MNPYPTRTELRRENAADALLAAQAASTAAYNKIVSDTQIALSRLLFPLGSPAKHFDVEDVIDLLSDMTIPRDLDALEQAAMDAARETV